MSEVVATTCVRWPLHPAFSSTQSTLPSCSQPMPFEDFVRSAAQRLCQQAAEPSVKLSLPLATGICAAAYGLWNLYTYQRSLTAPAT